MSKEKFNPLKIEDAINHFIKRITNDIYKEIVTNYIDQRQLVTARLLLDYLSARKLFFDNSEEDDNYESILKDYIRSISMCKICTNCL